MNYYISNWIFTETRQVGPCHIYRYVFYDQLGHIHSVCRECYKVVVRPKTIMDLLGILAIQIEMDIPAKCGLEIRERVHGDYGGYWYCRGLEHGRKVYKEVRELVPDHIDVSLKRYCSEYELGGIPSNETPDATQEDLDYEAEVMEDQLVEYREIGLSNRIPIVENWIQHAYAHGDETYLEANHGKKLYRECVTYH